MKYHSIKYIIYVILDFPNLGLTAIFLFTTHLLGRYGSFTVMTQGIKKVQEMQCISQPIRKQEQKIDGK